MARPRQNNPLYTQEDFTEFLRTRECAVLAAGELNTQVQNREFNEDKLAKIFLLDRRRKPSRFDNATLHKEISAYLSICGAFYKASTWLVKHPAVK